MEEIIVTGEDFSQKHQYKKVTYLSPMFLFSPVRQAPKNLGF